MKFRKSFLIGLFIFVIFIQILIADELAEKVKEISIDRMMNTIELLSSDEYEGRLTGAHGFTKAAKWATYKFKEMGLKPFYDDYLQPFPVFYNETKNSSLSVIIPAKGEGKEAEVHKMELHEDYVPFLSCGFGEVEAEVVFAGYGITAPEQDWDDYGRLEVKGKIVAVISGAPKIKGKNFDLYNSSRHRGNNAFKRGAVGLIILRRALASVSSDYNEGFPMAMAGESVAKLIFSRKGHDYKTVSNLLKEGHHIGFSTGINIRMSVFGVHHANMMGYNVVAILPGADPKLRNEYIIFGGHLDHLGKWPVLYPGANDNATGSAIVLEIAKAFSSMEKKPKRSVVFALFGGEEMGLLGSKYMANNLPGPPMKLIQMFNFDMNGVGSGIWVSGGKSYPEFYKIMMEVKEEFRIKCKIGTSTISPGRGGSDYASFLRKGYPSYSNWVTGAKKLEYHNPNDTIYLLTPKIMKDVVTLYFTAGYRFANK
jgi:hypothetical protein